MSKTIANIILSVALGGIVAGGLTSVGCSDDDNDDITVTTGIGGHAGSSSATGGSGGTAVGGSGGTAVGGSGGTAVGGSGGRGVAGGPGPTGSANRGGGTY